MCVYCEERDDNGIYIHKPIDDNGKWIEIEDDGSLYIELYCPDGYNGSITEWALVSISFCPMCGRDLHGKGES